MRQMTNDEGRPIYALHDWTIHTSQADDVVVLSLHYMRHGGERGVGGCPLNVRSHQCRPRSSPALH